MAHPDPGQIQCIEALQECCGPRLTALAFWRSPAAFSQELPAWGPVPACTLLPEDLTSLPREGVQLSCPRP